MQTLKVLFHIDEADKWRMLLGNIRNFIADAGREEYIVKAVVNGAAVNMFGKEGDRGILDEIADLAGQNVEFFACRNALRGSGIDEAALPPYIRTVPAGITKLVKLQAEGYAYIKP